jgi:hypothetical protein
VTKRATALRKLSLKQALRRVFIVFSPLLACAASSWALKDALIDLAAACFWRESSCLTCMPWLARCLRALDMILLSNHRWPESVRDDSCGNGLRACDHTVIARGAVLSSELLSGCIRSSSGGEPDSLDRGVRLGLDCTLGDLKPRLGASPKVSGSGSGLMPAKQWVVLRNAVL